MKGAALMAVLVVASALAGEPTCSNSSGEDLLSHDDCNKFYICDNGVLVERSCYPGLQFNSITNECDYPKNVGCGDRNPGEVVSKESEQKESEQEEETIEVSSKEDEPSKLVCSKEGQLLYHQNCDKFYKCSFGVPVEQNCPPGLEFNLTLAACDWPENVDCDNRENIFVPEENSKEPVPEETDPEEEGSQTELSCPDSDDERLFNHEECNKFWKCNYGVPVELNCPPNLYFNWAILACDWPENVDCDNRENIFIPAPAPEESGPETNPEEGGSPTELSCPESDEERLFNHEECNKFWKCSFGVPVELNCPPNLNFNFAILACDWPENVDCDNRENILIPAPVPEENGPETNPEEGGSPTEISCPDSSAELLFSHADCNKFYNCNFGVPVEQKCPANLNFNVATWQCDYPENVDCGDRRNVY